MLEGGISVVIPAYNCEGFIEETLGTVAGQRLSPEEVIVVDDGSTDGSAELVARFIRGRPGWSLLRKANGGVSSARNVGIRQARCDWIAFLDSDDLWQPGHLAELAALATESGAGVVVAGYEVFDSGGGQVFYSESVDPVMLRRAERRLLGENFIPPSSALVSRDSILAVGGFDEDPRIQHAEDWDLWIRLLFAGLSFDFTGSITMRYRRHPGNASADQAKMHRLGIHCLEKNLRIAPPGMAKQLRRGLSFRHRRLGNLAAVADRAAAGRHFRAAVAADPSDLLSLAALFLHLAHATPVYRRLAHR